MDNCGIVISLYKYVLGKQGNGTEDFIFGYFDAFQIRTIKKWLEFTPGKVNGLLSSAISESHPTSVSRYDLRLLFPDEEGRCALREADCYCEVWENGDDAIKEMLNKHPCVSVILVNLTDRFKKSSHSSTVDIFGEVLVRMAEGIKSFGIGEELRNAHTYIAPSLGYSDYCILMAEDDWRAAASLIEKMHGFCDSENNPILSTDYFIPVYHVCGNMKNVNADISVHVNLRPGVSMQRFANELNKDGILVYQLSGTSDCLCVPDSNVRGSKINLIKRITNLASMKGKNDDLLLSTRITLKWLITPASTDCSHDNTAETDKIKGSDHMQSVLDDLRKSLREYQRLAQKDRRHIRQIYAVYEIAGSIENIYREGHSYQLMKMLEIFLEDFTYSLNVCLDFMKEMQLERVRLKYWREIEKSLEWFRIKIGSYIADVTRSDCFSMETEKYNHPSISSATSMLLGYSSFINGFADKVRKLCEGSDSIRSFFIVTSGGCDYTEMTKLFPFLDPDEDSDGTKIIEERNQCIVQMSELGLFDCGGSMLRLMHECFHFCGERKRKDRLYYLVSFISEHFAYIFARELFQKIELVDRLKDEWEGLFQQNGINVLEQIYDNVKERLIENMSLHIKKEIFNSFHQDIDTQGNYIKFCENDSQEVTKEKAAQLALNIGEVQCLSRRVHDRLERILSIIFHGYYYSPDSVFRANKLSGELYMDIITAHSDFYSACYKAAQNGMLLSGSYASACIFEKRIFDIQIADSVQKLNIKENGEIKKHILFAMQRILANRNSITSIQDAYEIKKKFKRDAIEEAVDERYPGALLGDENVEVILDRAFEVFSESFADVASCTLMKAEFVDYILAFVFEKWTVDDSLIDSNDMIYRVGSVIHICFKDSLDRDSLSEEAENELNSAIDRMVAYCGMKKNYIKADELIKRINHLLSEYSRSKRIKAPLEEYLTICKEQYYDKWSDAPEIKSYQEAFQKMRICNFEKEHNHQQIIAMVKALTMEGRDNL